MTTTTYPTGRLDDIHRLEQELLVALAGLTDDQVRGPSSLPGWTRGHLLAHLSGVASAVARQLENAARDAERVDFYDGGRAGRDAAIELAASAPAAEHLATVRTAIDRLGAALARMTPETLARRTGHRDRPASALIDAWWRELAIHLTDLELGHDATTWTRELREHLVHHLADRAPAGVRLHLAATDSDDRWVLSDGAATAVGLDDTAAAADKTVTVRGSANDLVAWLAGRRPLSPVVAERSGAPVALPELAPWP